MARTCGRLHLARKVTTGRTHHERTVDTKSKCNRPAASRWLKRSVAVASYNRTSLIKFRYGAWRVRRGVGAVEAEGGVLLWGRPRVAEKARRLSLMAAVEELVGFRQWLGSVVVCTTVLFGHLRTTGAKISIQSSLVSQSAVTDIAVIIFYRDLTQALCKP